jgi:hypothetical protein
MVVTAGWRARTATIPITTAAVVSSSITTADADTTAAKTASAAAPTSAALAPATMRTARLGVRRDVRGKPNGDRIARASWRRARVQVAGAQLVITAATRVGDRGVVEVAR